MNIEDKFALGREVICHENELVNHRMTWLLLLTGFLFSAFFTLIAACDKVIAVFGAFYIGFAAAIIAFVGIFAAISAGMLITEAHAQTTMIRDWWDAMPGDKSNLPPRISGKWDTASWWRRFGLTENLAWFIAATWVVVLGLTIFFLCMHHAAAQ